MKLIILGGIALTGAQPHMIIDLDETTHLGGCSLSG